MKARLAFATMVMMSCVTLAACGNLPPPMAADAAAATDSYALGPGDKLRITVYNEPNLTGEYLVTPSGTVAFPLIGTVDARGQSIEAVQAAITAKLADGYVKDPRVSVEVLNYRPFYILGEVSRPGEYPYSAGLTVEQAIASAGGFTYRGNQRRVFLRRASSEGERTVDLRAKPVRILPGDTIRVGQRYF